MDGVTGDDSHSVFVTYPDGVIHEIPYNNSDNDNTAEFWFSNNDLQNGTYTYTVTDSSGNTSVEFSDHVIVNQIPCVSQGSISIKPNGTSPTINWAALSKDTVTHYQIDIRDDSNNNVQYLHVKDNSILIPPGFLAPHSTYKVYIKPRDGHRSFDVDNESISAGFEFTTGSETQKPYSRSDYWTGVKVWWNSTP